ncbi:MAG: UvrD-helicase domain-containing protein, partial [Prevotellaceae bacterium]|nr:UvrD-helicase domain-containing protein [Prevotellaceae bacterium]
MNIKEELNESQALAVEYCDGPSLVIAGAGSGKTRVLTYKLAYLLEHGYAPYHLLALTFTNKAAREMRQRIGKLVGEELATQLWMGTFHSIFARILRIESARIGYESNYTIYDEADSKSLLKRIIKEKELDEKCYKIGNVMGRISEAKNRLILPEAYENDRYARTRDENSKMPELYDIYQTYSNRCRQANAMDFDDL